MAEFNHPPIVSEFVGNISYEQDFAERQAIEARTEAESILHATEKAERGNARHVAAPFAGVVTLQVDEGDAVESGQTVATIEAMKMEASITVQRAGTVKRLAIGKVQQVEGGDLLLELE